MITTPVNQREDPFSLPREQKDEEECQKEVIEFHSSDRVMNDRPPLGNMPCFFQKEKETFFEWHSRVWNYLQDLSSYRYIQRVNKVGLQHQAIMNFADLTQLAAKFPFPLCDNISPMDSRPFMIMMNRSSDVIDPRGLQNIGSTIKGTMDGESTIPAVAEASSIPATTSSTQNSAVTAVTDDRRYIDNRWICLKDGDFYEFANNDWTKVDEDEIESLNDQWNKSHPIPATPTLQREIDGRWIYPSGETFLEFVNNEWKEIDPTTIIEIRTKYDAADPYRKVVNGITMKYNIHLQQWLPEIEVNDDFVAMYQANYGVAIDYSKLPPSEKELKLKELEEKQKAKEERKRKAAEGVQEAGWTEISDQLDTHVYVSNLPTDITDKEFMEFMEKVGVIMKDPRTNKPKIKLYRTPEGDLKGDGTCCYVKPESVELALTILDGWELNKHKVHVEKAKFQMKGEFDPSKKKKRLTVDQKKKFIEKQNKAFEWEPEKPRNYRPPSDRTVILKNVFGLDEMIKNVTLALDLKEIIKERCERFGKIIKIVVYENHPDGIVSVSYSTVEEADYCVQLLNRGIMRHRKIEAFNWDGKTKYKVKESEEDQKRRDQEWKSFLEDEEEEEQEDNDEEGEKKIESNAKESDEKMENDSSSDLLN